MIDDTAPMRSRPAVLISLVVGLCMLALVWRLLPPGAPPVYDSLCIEGAYTTHPKPASVVLPLSNGDIQTSQVTTLESPQPQAELIVASKTLQIPAGATSVKVTIKAVPHPTDTPLDASYEGNVYQFSLTTNTGSAVTLLPHMNATIVLSPTSQSAGPTRIIELYDGSHWQKVTTLLLGCADALAIQATSFGDYAVVTLNGGPGSKPATPTSGASRLGLTLVIVGVLLLLFIGLALLISRRGHQNELSD